MAYITNEAENRFLLSNVKGTINKYTNITEISTTKTIPDFCNPGYIRNLYVFVELSHLLEGIAI